MKKQSVTSVTAGAIFSKVFNEKQLAADSKRIIDEKKKEQIQLKKEQILAKIASLQTWFEELLEKEPQFKEYLDRISKLKKSEYITGVYRRSFRQDNDGEYSIVVELLIEGEGYKYLLALNHSYGEQRTEYCDVFNFAQGYIFSDVMKELNLLAKAVGLAVENSMNAELLISEVIDGNQCYIEQLEEKNEEGK